MNNGLEVKIQQSPITQDGWSGAGNGGFQGSEALLALIKLSRTLATFGIIAAAVNPFILFAVGVVTLLLGAMSENPFAENVATFPISIIMSLMNLGALAFAFFGLGFAASLLYVMLLVYVANLVREAVFVGR